jgi:arylsulfatase A-like enzyme
MQRRYLFIAASLAAVGAAIGWQLFERYWYYVPGMVAAIRDPVGPTRDVHWNQGPEVAAEPASARPPNIVVILADDLGWNDLTFNGGGVAGGKVPTPNINSIAADGITFTQAYAGDATCAPSRAAIMTGRYATRFGFEFTPAPVAFEKLISTFANGDLKPLYHAAREKDIPASIDEETVPTSEITIAQVVQSKGYHTHMLGKWHLGGTPATRPDARGFDEALGFYPGASMYLPADDPNVVNSRQDFDPIDKFLWANLPFGIRFNGSKQFAPSSYMTDYLGAQAVQAIAANRNRPFFMYLAFNAPHTPLQALKADYDALSQIPDHRLRVYAAMIRALDRNVGNVLGALKANGLEENTLVIFTSDNGGANYIGLPDINKPFRGWKATFFEGGIHVPFFMKWPAKLPKGAKFDRPVGHVDIFATTAAAAAADVPRDRVMDGVDLLPFVAGPAQDPPHQTLFWRDGSYKVLLAGDWKLQVAERPMKDWLFNLKDDPTEKNNLAGAMPDKVNEMKGALAAIDAEQARPLWPALLEGPVRIDHPLGFPNKPDDEYIYWAN